MAVKAASKLTLLLTDLVEHHSAEGERSFHADRLGKSMLHILEPGGRYFFFRQPGSSQGVLSK